MQLLLAHRDIKVNIKDKDRRTPLSVAIENDHPQIIKLLLQDKDVDAKALIQGDTPLIFAMKLYNAKYIKIKTVAVLLEFSKIEVNRFVEKGLFPLLSAVSRGQSELVHLLLKRQDIDVNCGECEGLY